MNIIRICKYGWDHLVLLKDLPTYLNSLLKNSGHTACQGAWDAFDGWQTDFKWRLSIPLHPCGIAKSTIWCSPLIHAGALTAGERACFLVPRLPSSSSRATIKLSISHHREGSHTSRLWDHLAAYITGLA